VALDSGHSGSFQLFFYIRSVEDPATFGRSNGRNRGSARHSGGGDYSDRWVQALS
jgi:hypothetical protein